MKYIFTLLLSLTILVGCGANLPFKQRVEQAGDVAVAVASFPLCRAEWEVYIPDPIKLELATEVALLDKTFEKFITLVKDRPSISFSEGLNKIASVGTTQLMLESSFERISGETVSYAISSDNRSPVLAQCDADTRRGWSALTADSPLLNWIKAYAPYAKAGVQLLPMLLQEFESSDNVTPSVAAFRLDDGALSNTDS